MSSSDEITPCSANNTFKKRVNDYAEALKSEAFRVGEHGLSEEEFYNSGLFKAAIERIRGQQSASMGQKREFVTSILNYLESQTAIKSWESASEKNRFDYEVQLNDGKIAIIEIKGCLDGNNTNIFDRPPHASEFIIWSLCQNTGADPRKNAWSGIHTRLGAEIINREQVVDGLIIWDWVCGTAGRICPKVIGDNKKRITSVGAYQLPPPCLYYFPRSVPKPRNNPKPPPQRKDEVSFLNILATSFSVVDSEINYVTIEVAYQENAIVRKTKVKKNAKIIMESNFTELKRS